MKALNIPLSGTGLVNPLIVDYLNGKSSLEPFYKYSPNLKGLENAISERKNYPVNRQVLVEELTKQYSTVPEKDVVVSNINLLLEENTYTVTTGHQLSIFTGPLFFIYKIISTIKYCQILKEAFPDNNFLPVYWMASEDHDLEEINHIHLWGKIFRWEEKEMGAVGKMPTNLFEKTIEDLSIAMGEKGKELTEIFQKAYLQNDNLASATRSLVHALFGAYGLICLDADNSELKKLFAQVIQQDILRQNVEKAVIQTKEKLSEYKLPVNPRKINVFYLTNSGRYRIIDEDGFFQVKEVNLKWKVDELLKELELFPEKFSPNVVLRPMYQEVILPNLAYIGGNNEIAYWFELKQAFELMHVFFPQLLVRDSALWLGKRALKDLDTLDLKVEDALLKTEEMKAEYLKIHDLIHPAMGTIDNILEDYGILREDIQDVNKNTVSEIIKGMNLQQKELKKWKSQIKASLEEQEEKNLSKIDKIHSAVYPDGEFQERYENFIPYYLQYRSELIDILLDTFNPLKKELHIFLQE